MPPPMLVELRPRTPAWAEAAEREAARLAGVLGGQLGAAHQVGSTAIPGIRTKPIRDLLPVVREPAALDAVRPSIATLGHARWGEHRLPGRRCCTLADPATGLRRLRLHRYERGRRRSTGTSRFGMTCGRTAAWPPPARRRRSAAAPCTRWTPT